MDYDKIIGVNARKIPPSGIRKFFDIAAEMKDCISLGVGEPDFVTPGPFREAAIKSINQGKTQYTSNSGLKELRMAVTCYLHESIGVSFIRFVCAMRRASGRESRHYRHFGGKQIQTYSRRNRRGCNR